MSKILTYLFDPLCGWCYGAGGPLPQILETTGLPLQLVPTGLFSGEGARPMDADFALYAWNNDQRIARLTGQVFSERYREQVLADTTQAFDSGPATLALTAVHLDASQREFEALKAVQHARYVDGRDITRLDVLSEVLSGLGLARAAARLAQPDAPLLQHTQARTADGARRLRKLGAQGVPTFVLDDGEQARQLHASAIFTNPQAFAHELGMEA